MAKRPVAQGMRVFLLVWCGQLISLIGSGLTKFALGVWVYESTGSVTQFALISVFARLPAILLFPVAGALIDRWNRRWAMILSDSGASLSTVAVALLLVTGRLEIWHIYLAVAVSSAFSAFQWPAYTAATTLLLPKQQMGRASGMIQLGEAAAQFIAPMLAAGLLSVIHLQGIILADFATFLFSLVTLLSIRFPDAKTSTVRKPGALSLVREMADGWTYITARPGLLGLLIFIAASNFAIGIAQVLFAPLILAFAPVAVLGTVQSIACGGMVVGSIMMSVWGGPKRRVYGVFGFEMLLGLSIFLLGVRASIPLIMLAGFGAYFSAAIFLSSTQAILQTKVAPEVQGRVFAVRRTIGWSSYPLAALVAGPLADRIFEPLMAVNGLLAGSIGQIIGTGTGRGIGLLFAISGAMVMLVTVAGYQYPRLRLLEDELPDVIAGEPAAKTQ
ncbi:MULTISPECIES: MFS transporter [unclassified Microcoleus]|uniref:MFS transporter n=1 Tax=unclassified Microcoleus TaxID=2642155 RepID=UPI002FCF5D12